jgi:hypothetical protein
MAIAKLAKYIFAGMLELLGNRGAGCTSYFSAVEKSTVGSGTIISSSKNSSLGGGAPLTSFAGAFGGGALPFASFPYGTTLAITGA